MSADQDQRQQPSDPYSKQEEEEDQEAFTFPVASPSRFFVSPRLMWRRVPTTANSSPATRLEILRSKYRRRSFSCMETESFQMMSITVHDQDDREKINKMDLLWEDLHEHSELRNYSDDNASSDLDQVGTELSSQQKRRALSLPVRRSPGSVAIFKVLKKLFYVRKTGSTQSI